MRLPTQFRQRTPLKFNITPLIDVVFLLIIFFLVASHFVRSEQSEPVPLPHATGGKADDQTVPRRLTVTITRDGTFYVSGQAVSEADVRRRIDQLAADADAGAKPPQLRLRGHRDGRYGPMRKLIEYAAAKGITSIHFAVETGTGGGR